MKPIPAAATARDRQPPTMAGLPLLGVSLQFLRDPPALFMAALRMGDVVKASFGVRTVYLVNHPDLVRRVLVENADNYRKSDLLRTLRIVTGDGLVISEGPYWRRQRNLVQPAFSQEYAAGFAEKIIAATGKALDRWSASPEGQAIDVVPEMMRLTMRCIIHCLFGLDLPIADDSMSNAVKVVMREVVRRIVWPLSFPLSIPTPRNRRFKRQMALIDGLIARVMEERRSRAGNRGGRRDLIDAWLAERDPATGTPMTPEQLRNEIVTMFIAGHETTGSALAWAWHLLAENPSVCAQLEEEVDRVLGGRTPTPDDLPKLTYTRMVFQEVTRLYPQPPQLRRVAVEEDVLGEYRIPKGAELVMPTYAIHRDPRFWQDPDVFDPARFGEDRKHERQMSAYLPFGLGHRSCVGARLATLEATIVLAMTAQRFRLDSVGGRPVEAELLAALQPRGGLPMVLRRRRVVAAAA